MTIKLAYLRVSTDEQSFDRQMHVISEAGITIADDCLYCDKQSGKNANRDQLQECLKALKGGMTLVITSLDRLARNTIDTLTIVQQIQEKGAGLIVVSQPQFNFAAGSQQDPMTKMMMNLMSGFAEMEREFIRERQRQGIEAAKKRGVQFGPKRVAVTLEQVQEAIEQCDGSKQAAAKKLGIGKATLYRILKAV